jgi:hypothetical protein
MEQSPIQIGGRPSKVDFIKVLRRFTKTNKVGSVSNITRVLPKTEMPPEMLNMILQHATQREQANFIASSKDFRDRMKDIGFQQVAKLREVLIKCWVHSRVTTQIIKLFFSKTPTKNLLLGRLEQGS